MKKYEQLSIYADEEKISALMSRLRQDARSFKFLKKISEDYARNIFVKSSQTACFKCVLDSMSRSTIWLVQDGDCLTLTNITPESAGRLSIVDYNVILNSFFQEVLAPLIDDSFNVQISGENVQMSDVLGESVYSALILWERSCNKSAPISFPEDYKRWMHFICLLFDSGVELTPIDLVQWLQEDCGWPMVYCDQMDELSSKLEYSMDLLSTYINEDRQ